jgi:hypothetical protein
MSARITQRKLLKEMAGYDKAKIVYSSVKSISCLTVLPLHLQFPVKYHCMYV